MVLIYPFQVPIRPIISVQIGFIDTSMNHYISSILILLNGHVTGTSWDRDQLKFHLQIGRKLYVSSELQTNIKNILILKVTSVSATILATK